MANAASSSFRIKRVKVPVYRAPRPLPPWRPTMMVAHPDQKKADGWIWSTHRNGHVLSTEQKAAYARGELLVIAVPEPLAEFGDDDLKAILAPVEARGDD
jgi:hypothetical protein